MQKPQFSYRQLILRFGNEAVTPQRTRSHLASTVRGKQCQNPTKSPGISHDLRNIARTFGSESSESPLGCRTDGAVELPVDHGAYALMQPPFQQALDKQH